MLLNVSKLKKYFPVRSGIFGRIVGWVKAVDDISFNIRGEETLALVGESGCGKTTTARCILGLTTPTSGEIYFMGREVYRLKGEELKWYRRNVQAVFQNPYLSLNPRMKVRDIVAEPLRVHEKTLTRVEVEDRVLETLEKVGLGSELISRYPYDLSGGQAQRVAIARAIVLKPRLVILDEPTSALDVSVQAQILNLLVDLKEDLKLSYLIISHDLSVVRYVSDRVAVMYLGKIVESSEVEELFKNPLHPYTQALLSAAPEPDPQTIKLKKRIELPGEPPSALNPPKGCRLNPRCPHVMEKCKIEEPILEDSGRGHLVACWLYS